MRRAGLFFALVLAASPYATAVETAVPQADRWTADGVRIAAAIIQECLSTQSNGCAAASYTTCAREHGNSTEIDLGECVRIAHDAWKQILASELPVRGSVEHGDAAKVVLLWEEWAQQVCEIAEQGSSGGSAHSRLVVTCKLHLAEATARELRLLKRK
jgi:hypothetical protein